MEMQLAKEKTQLQCLVHMCDPNVVEVRLDKSYCKRFLTIKTA